MNENLNNLYFDLYDEFDFNLEKEKLIDNLNYLKSMSVQEQTLYRKWLECKSITNKFESSIVTSEFIWKPTDLNNKELTIKQIESLEPIIINVNKETKYNEHWNNVRIYSHSMEYHSTPGRFIRLIIIDKNTEKILGISSLSSDFILLSPRDKYIGWNETDKYDNGKLNNTSVASCIMSTQPFGYNFLGGKMVASLLSTKQVRDIWKKEYGNTLVALNTTSLYGTNSMYNSIPYWKKLGESSGNISLKPDDYFYDKWIKWLKINKKEEYYSLLHRKDGKNVPVTSAKYVTVKYIFNLLNIKLSDYMHGFKRGVYMSEFYKNSKEFLTSKISENDLILNDKFIPDYNGIMIWWRKKAIHRYTNLYDNNRLNNNDLWYNKIGFMSWEETKDKYLNDVGR